MTLQQAYDVIATASPSPEEDGLYQQWYETLQAHPERLRLNLGTLAVHLLTDVICMRVVRECPGDRAGMEALLQEYLRAVVMVYQAKCVTERYPVQWWKEQEGV
jgi:hypothetical protein